MLRLESVSFGRGDRLVLDQVTLAVNPGELVVVVGERASGKSALAAIAAARRAPDRGAVWVSDRNVAELQRSSLPFVRRNVGYLAPAWAPLIDDETALENVMLVGAVRGESVAASEEQARAALAAVLGESSDLDLERPVAALSASERHLVALARALCGPTPVVVLDEPAAGVAAAADRERVVAALVAARDRNAAVLVTTGDERLAADLVLRGARRVKLEDGRTSGGLPAMTLMMGGGTSTSAGGDGDSGEQQLPLQRRGAP